VNEEDEPYVYRCENDTCPVEKFEVTRGQAATCPLCGFFGMAVYDD